MRPKRRGEACELPQRRLLHNTGNDRAIMCQMRRNGKQQRTSSSNNYPLSLDGITALHQSLQAASTEDSWQSPSWKREKPFPRSGGQNQLFETELLHERAG